MTPPSRTAEEEAREIVETWSYEADPHVCEADLASLGVSVASAIRAARVEGARAGIDGGARAIRRRADKLSDESADGNAVIVGSMIGAALLLDALDPAAVVCEAEEKEESRG